MARADQSRGLRDEANVGPDPRRARQLRPLKELNWKVTDGEPDIRGWAVWASTGRELGVVDDLLVDTEAGEVVMLDVDLKRDDRHTLAPLRAAWIDRTTKRVVVDARELGAADTLPALPRTGALTDDDVARFNDGYVRAYGARGYDEDREYRLRRGDEELRFGATHRGDEREVARDVERADERAAAQDTVTPKRLLDPGEYGTRAAAPSAAPNGTLGAASNEGRAINAALVDLPRHQAASKDTGLPRSEYEIHQARMRDLGYPDTTSRDDAMEDAVIEDAARRDAAAHDAERRLAAAPEGEADRRTFDRKLDDRDAGLESIPDDGAIEPRELDARVRIDEGATVDEQAPVGGVRYDSPDYPHHDYGDIADERTRDERTRDGRGADERAAERIFDDHVVSRHRADDAAGPADLPPASVHYRPFDGYGKPDDSRA